MKGHIKLDGKVYDFEADTTEELGDMLCTWLRDRGYHLRYFTEYHPEFTSGDTFVIENVKGVF